MTIRSPIRSPLKGSIRLITGDAGSGVSPAFTTIETANLVEFWSPTRDDAGNGTTTLNGEVGGYDASLVNMDAATDWVSDTDATYKGVRALDIDGINDTIRVPFNAAFSTPAYTVSFWYKHGGNPVDLGRLYSRRTANISQTPGVITLTSDGLISLYVRVSLSNVVAAGAHNMQVGQWYHIVGTCGGTQAPAAIAIYVNNILIQQTSLPGGSISLAGSPTIQFGSGANQYSTEVYSQVGRFDCMSYTARVWTSEERAAAFAAGRNAVHVLPSP